MGPTGRHKWTENSPRALLGALCRVLNWVKKSWQGTVERPQKRRCTCKGGLFAARSVNLLLLYLTDRIQMKNDDVCPAACYFQCRVTVVVSQAIMMLGP